MSTISAFGLQCTKQLEKLRTKCITILKVSLISTSHVFLKLGIHHDVSLNEILKFRAGRPTD